MAIVNGLFSVKSLFSNSTTVPFCNCQLNETVTVGGSFGTVTGYFFKTTVLGNIDLCLGEEINF